MTMLPLVHRTNPCVSFWTRALTLFIVLSIYEHARPQQPTATASSTDLAQERHVIDVAEREHVPEATIGYLWGRLASGYAAQADFARAEDAYFRSLRLLKDAPEAQKNYATLLDNLGVLYLAYDRRTEAEQYLKSAFAARKKQGDIIPIGISQMHLAELALANHKFKQAEKIATEAQANLTAAGDSGRAGLIGAFVALAYARCERNKCAEGLHDAEQAMELARFVYPSDSLPTGHVLMAMGFAKWKSGDNQQAEKMMLEGIHIVTTKNAPGAPNSRLALFEYRDFLNSMNRSLDVKRIDDQLALTTPQPCANCTVNVNSMSNALR
ncbi:tetratricopeptide repeat protein [Edaphobacter aggregans]|uniref:tetratricopeptide repeat protein n=1 Tax=Edaphobacter aggregans TaxID=570835 RepID=UPI00054D08F7|nr:tetratricopeptide repeat protein [Edaphobacter aggregans]